MPDRQARGAAGPCVELETLAAFVDERVDHDTAQAVRSHLAACESCYELVVELLHAHDAQTDDAVGEKPRAGLAAPGTEPRPGRMSWRRTAILAGAPLAAAAALLIVINARPDWWPGRASGRDPLLADLASALREDRPAEGRVTGGFAYSPWRGVSRSGSPLPTDNLSLLAEAGKLQKAAEANPSAANLHSWGVAQLALRQYDNAIATLELAHLEDPARARYAADLGTARLARATAADRPDDLPRALEAIETALKIDPALAEAWFTKAILLERLGMRQQAIDAWERYLEIDRDSAWRAEAQQRLARLRAQAGPGRWPELERALRQPTPAAADVAEAVAQYPEDVRDLLVSELLPAFAAALRSQQSAAGSAEAIARTLATTASDPQFNDALLDLRAAAPARLSVLADAMAPLGTGWRAVLADRAGDADADLTRAATVLDAEGSALWQWAALGLARVHYSRLRNTEALAVLNRILDPASAASSIVAGRAHSLAGIITFTLGRWSEAAAHYERALDLCDRGGERRTSANAHVNAAILQRFLGNQPLTWKHRLAAGSALPQHRPLQQHVFLLSGAATAAVESLPETALLFQTEAVANAQAHLAAGPKVETFVARARMMARRGRHDEAERDLRDAAALLDQMADSATQPRLQRAWLLASAEVRTDSAPAQAAADAARAVSMVAAAGETMRSAELRLFESRALARLQQPDAARRAALQGIADFERALGSIDARDQARLSAFEPVWELYSQAARLSLAADGRFDQAFTLVERRRARTTTDVQGLARLALPDVQARLREDEAILLMDQGRDELVIWCIRRDGVQSVHGKVGELELRRLTARHRRAINADRRRDEASATLYDHSIRRLLPLLGKITSAAVIPDGAWHDVAWPSLWDRESGREVVDALRIVVSPSASIAVGRRWQPVDAAATRALVVAATVGTATTAALPAARIEARDVSRMYPQARLLEAADATPAAVSAALPHADVVHVSSHAVDVPAYPLLSHLVLAGPGAGAELFARDIAALSLARPRVVVVAACATAGRGTIRGEGSVGVAWGFLTAGVPRVIATLQEIDDEPSRELFTSVHREIVAGRSPADALSVVQRRLAAAGASPRVWAAVISLGGF